MCDSGLHHTPLHHSYGQHHLLSALLVCHPGKDAAGLLRDQRWAGEGVTHQDGENTLNDRGGDKLNQGLSST